MSEPILLLIRAVDGGVVVLLFAVIGEVLRPKRFAGVLGAAPAVALGSLIVVSLAEGRAHSVSEARGMLLGAVAMIVACLVAVAAVRRWRAVRGSAALWLTWLVVGTAGYLAVFR